MRESRARRVAVFVVLGALVGGAPATTRAAETDMAISTSALDFGSVNVGSTATAAVTLTNTGGDPFGPINMFGGAPPTAEFNASQNCQGQTLPAGGSCQVTYSFSPGTTGTFSDSSNFTISETPSQGDGEDFSVALTGVGVDPSATTTTAAPTTTTTTPTTTTTTPTTTTAPPTPTTPRPQAPGRTEPTATTSSSTSTTTSTTVPVTWPLTGTGVVARPALVVTIDNVEATPQAGLNQADVVFEEIVEGRATRFAAVFNSMTPDPVGPVRAARAPDVELLAALGDPAFAYLGAAADVNARLEAAGFELLTESGPGFFRDPGRPEPANLFANLSALFPTLTSSDPAVPIFAYAPDLADLGGTPVAFVEMMVGGQDVAWKWDAGRGLFLRSQLGAPHELTDGPASARNVVVLVVEYAEGAEGAGPEATTIGSGDALVYTAGRRVAGTWSRASAEAPFTLTDANGPVLLAPGRTWVELVDAQHGLTDG